MDSFRICFTDKEGVADLDTLLVNEVEYQLCLDVVMRILGWSKETEDSLKRSYQLRKNTLMKSKREIR